MTYLPVQAHYHAHRLLAAGNGEEAFTRSLSSARVEMNPHQVDAALFALKSPLSKGVMLADEVGLGKTIEAGLVMSQRWAEQRRRILLVVPASLRKQWSQELWDKFALRSRILEARTFNDLVKGGQPRPFDMTGAITIVSYDFAARKADDIRAARWNLVVFDEAHRLRNVWKKDGAKGAKALKAAVGDRFKIMLTATPLQNSLMELYGLVSILDETHFGGANAFRTQFVATATPVSQELLRQRLRPICHRTLRRQVQEAGHINFRKRHALTFTFEPYDEEARLYEALSEYLQDPNTIAYGGSTNALVLLQARKQLGSSTFATAQYLTSLLERLRREERATLAMTDDLEDALIDEEEALDGDDDAGGPPVDPARLASEVALVEGMRDLALSIGTNAKGDKLLQSLPGVLDEIEAKGGQRKAVIFTESVRTQKYLAALLEANGYAGRLVLMNGSNSDALSRSIYDEWRQRHAGTDRISGSRTADMKAAIVDAFRGPDRTILLATESGAEGINLQFCSLLINYDLPWNPQRVEQRIGRCHRYGQLIDVTVVNMLNLKNRAEERIHQLLRDKLHLFEGVFGASDEVLGILADGIDFEREILGIVQSCRTEAEADREFDELTARIQDSISAVMTATRAKVLENMDGDVVAMLHRRGEQISTILPEFERRLLMVARAELAGARFDPADPQVFTHDAQRWTTRWQQADAEDWQFLRVNEGLGEAIVNAARDRRHDDAPRAVTLDHAAYPFEARLSGVPELAGQSGWLTAMRATMPVKDAAREEIMVVAHTDAGEVVPGTIADRLLMCPARDDGAPAAPLPADRLSALADEAFGEFATRMRDENNAWLMEEDERLTQYARDLEIETQARIAAADEEIAELTRAARSQHLTMEEKLALKRQANKLQDTRDDLVFNQHEAKKRVRREVGRRLDDMEALLRQEPRVEPLFTLRWTVAPGALASPPPAEAA